MWVTGNCIFPLQSFLLHGIIREILNCSIWVCVLSSLLLILILIIIFLGQFCPRGKGAMRANPRATLGMVTARVRCVHSGSLTSHRINYEELWDWTSGLLQMYQRQHFLLVRPGFELTSSHTVVRHSNNLANWSANRSVVVAISYIYCTVVLESCQFSLCSN